MLYFLVILAQFCRVLIAGIGLQLTYSTAGITFLGFPAVVNISAYTMAILQREGMEPWLAFGLALLMAAVVSLIFASIYQRISEDSFVVICLASIFAVEALINSWEPLTNGVLGISGIARPTGLQSLQALTMTLVILAVIALLGAWLVFKSSLGRKLRALREDKLLLEAIGISTTKISRGMIVLSGVLCCLTANFWVWQIQYLDPSLGSLLLLLELLTVSILAIKPKVIYVVIGTAFVVLMPEILRLTDLPSTVLGYLRSLLYAVSLLILIFLLKDRLIIKKRTI